jgi:ATP-dependent helicase/nuclease subunit B
VTPLGGLLFRGATRTEFDDVMPGNGLLGSPVWNRTGLLADLELRLGIPTVHVDHGVRLQQWSQRLADVSRTEQRFFSKSYEVDRIGTATTLLAWRDLLVDSGWNGEAVPEGGPRLATFVELERGLNLPLGAADRLCRVEAELASTTSRPWAKLQLADDFPAWPERWRRVFALLAERGVVVEHAVPRLDRQAPPDSDLGRLQASIRGEAVAQGFQGDGSLVLLTGETSWELAHAVAAFLKRSDVASTVVLRGGDLSALDTAFKVQGLAAQGFDSESRWRPAVQLLPLALELAYEPRDPYRMLELVTLPLGPFAGWVGLQLARAISESPGIGGRAWEKAKQAIAAPQDRSGTTTTAAVGASPVPPADPHPDRLALIAEWLEVPGHEQEPGAPRSHLLDVALRVINYLRTRLVRATIAAERGEARGAHDEAILGAAFSQAQAFHAAVSHDTREHLDLVAVRQLLEEVSLGPVSLPLGGEEVGRIDIVDTPAGLRCNRGVVVWWHCVGGTQSVPAVDPWRVSERAALSSIGVRLADRSALLAAEVEGWRRVVVAAEKQLVLVVPGAAQGTRLDAHPIWDELAARVKAEPSDTASVTITASELLSRSKPLAQHFSVSLEGLTQQVLPMARAAWHVAPSLLGNMTSYSATSLEDLLGCPLTWVLKHRAGLRSAWALGIASGPLLNGRLGHRLIEELHRSNTFATQPGVGIADVLERLINEEAAVLRRPGMTFELSQLRHQMIEGVERLATVLAESGLSIAEVEIKTTAELAGRSIEGRLDVLLVNSEGKEVVLDLKWGRNTYEKRLRAGLALQLATYAATRQVERGHDALPAVAYFALSRGTILTTERDLFVGVRPIPGPGIHETWSSLERTLVAVEKLLAKGTSPVTGVAASTSLLESVGLHESEHARHLEPGPGCDYCRHATLCGRAWEGMS